jgi:hypothetical protein
MCQIPHLNVAQIFLFRNRTQFSAYNITDLFYVLSIAAGRVMLFFDGYSLFVLTSTQFILPFGLELIYNKGRFSSSFLNIVTYMRFP